MIDNHVVFNTFCDTKDPQNTSLKILVYNPQVLNSNPFDPITYEDAVKKRGLIMENLLFDSGMMPYQMNKNHLLHRMGDLLGLWHTESGEPQFTVPNYFYGLPENVTRDHDNVNFNADRKGDFVEDTPAETFLNYGDNTTYDNNCNYVSVNAPFYDFASPNPEAYPSAVPINVMQTDFGFYTGPSCNIFTAGQGRKMRETIAASPIVFYGNIPLSNALTNVKSLYQPYSQDLLMSTNMSPLITDHGSSATVCRFFYYGNYKFQKGFDYIFPDSTFPDVLTVSTNEIPYVVNPMFNYPVTILQLATGQTNLTSNTGFVLNNDKNTICTEEPYTTGIKSFTSQILSSQIVTESLSETQIKDPDFYNNLESQKLYKIIKQTFSGAKTQEIFYKQ